MARVNHSLIVIVFSLSLIGSSSPKKDVSIQFPYGIYANIQKKLQKGKWKQAIAQLEHLSNRYPSSPYFQQIQFDLIYAYYKNNDLFLARNVIDRFIRLNPVHPNIDYIFYMRGLVNMEMDDNTLQRFFGVDRSNCNPDDARSAFNDFFRLVYIYPNSQYASDAIKRMIFLKNRLATYEYLVACYYAKRSAWIAVIDRVESMLHDYPDTKATRNGLKLIENAYRKMKMRKQAERIAAIIAANVME